MGDYADDAFDRDLNRAIDSGDALFMRAPRGYRTWKADGHTLRQKRISPEYEQFRVRACNRCGAKGLEWVTVLDLPDEPWRLFDSQTSKLHTCNRSPE
jgi:hypothetical protein